MRICAIPLGLLCALTLFGQKSSNSTWQNSCFNNPALPYCQGRDFAVKPVKPGPPTGKTGLYGTAPATTTPSTVSGIDWRFADPNADVVLGLNLSALAGLPLARNLIAELGAKQNLTAADLKKIFDGLSGINQIAVSVRDNRFVVMLTGRVTELSNPTPEPGMKSAPVSGTAMLFGSAEAVDQAAQRIAMKAPLSDLAKSAEERQTSSEFWATGGAGIAGPEAVGAGLKRFWLTAWVRESLTTDVALEFDGPPNAKTLQLVTMPGATIEGNAINARMSIGAAETQQVVSNSVGARLGALVSAARQLPLRDLTVLKQTRPVIYGLEGGPKVVGQQP